MKIRPDVDPKTKPKYTPPSQCSQEKDCEECGKRKGDNNGR